MLYDKHSKYILSPPIRVSSFPLPLVPLSFFLKILRYELGQLYKAHHDSDQEDVALACGPRILTFFLYLSDVEEGTTSYNLFNLNELSGSPLSSSTHFLSLFHVFFSAFFVLIPFFFPFFPSSFSTKSSFFYNTDFDEGINTHTHTMYFNWIAYLSLVLFSLLFLIHPQQ